MRDDDDLYTGRQAGYPPTLFAIYMPVLNEYGENIEKDATRRLE